MQRYSLNTCLERQIADDADRALVHSIFGTADIQTICHLLNQYCQQQFGQPIATCTFAYLSVGATVIVQLTDGTDLVLKANGLHDDLTGLIASFTIQNTLANQGFPCPAILRSPQPYGTTILTAQTVCAAGERINSTDPHIRTTLARHLAKLIRQTSVFSQQGIPVWMELHRPQLWHRPHNILFDFKKTAAGAEWIDAIAQRAKPILRQATGPLVIGHSDWSLQNMSFCRGTLTCVYDWDSLRVGPEPCFVGGAARCFRHDWRYGPPEVAIAVDEVQEFVATYERERGQEFSRQEQRVLGAAVVYTAAYGMRCVHAVKPADDDHYQNSKCQLYEFTEAFLSGPDSAEYGALMNQGMNP